MSLALVTGGTGCIGAVAVRDLLRLGVERVAIATRNGEPQRLKHWLGDELDDRVAFVALDLADVDALGRAVADLRPTHVVHLAALQSPDCERDPLQGMRVNVGGTEALLNACATLAPRLRQFVFASSAAVYGPRAMYPGALVHESDPLAPPNRYGVWKLAGEHLARLFCARTGIPTFCWRLNATYGPGRDRGLTSAPTRALKTVAHNAVTGERREFAMPYQGRENYHYVEDVGAHFALAAMSAPAGFHACNLRGTTIEVAEFLRLVGEVAREQGIGDAARLHVPSDAAPNLFVCDLDEAQALRLLPAAPKTALRDGIARSLRAFCQMAAAGELELDS